MFTCQKCAKEVESARLPRGWKAVPDPTCDKCLATNYVVRAVSLPVAKILGTQEGGPSAAPVPVQGFLNHFTAAWRMATDLSNWAVQELVRRDVRRLPGMTTLPRYVSVNLYRTWNQECPAVLRQAWEGAAGSASAVLRQVETAWKGHKSFGRYAVLWQGKAAPMVYRFPTAFPVREQDWRPVTLPGGAPGVSVTLPGARYLLELDRSPELRRQLRDFAQFVSGAATRADLKLVPVERGGRLVGAKAVLVGRFTRAAAPDPSQRVMAVSTGAECFFRADSEGVEPWVWHGDSARGAVLAHVRWLARYRHDMKYEKRWPAAKRRRMVEGGAAAKIARQRGRVDSELKQACAAVVGYAQRQHCGTLTYDDSERSFCPSWPWAATRERLRQLCSERGILFQHVAVQQVNGVGDS